jgi:DNA-binding CsgD family transcriptional regulator
MGADLFSAEESHHDAGETMTRQVLDDRVPAAPQPPMRGRDEQLDQVLAAMDTAAGQALVAAAAAGMGKTRLLLAAAELAARRGFAVVDCVADQPNPIASPLGVVGLPMVRQPRAVGPATDRLSWLTEQFESHVREQLRRGPVLVTLDDIHWVDPLTLVALRKLMARLDGSRLVWLLAIRSEELDTPNGVLLRAMAVGERGTWLRPLRPLTDHDVADVAGDLLDATPGRDVTALCESMGGRPRDVVELVEGLLADGALYEDAGVVRLSVDADSVVPTRFLALMRERMGRLDPRTRHVVQIAAVLGRSFTPRALADMLNEPPAALLKPLQEAIGAGLITSGVTEFSFHREPVWLAVLDSVPALMLPLLQEAATRLVDRAPQTVTALAALTRTGELERAPRLAPSGYNLAIASLLKGETGRAARTGSGDVRLAALSYCDPRTAEEIVGVVTSGVERTVRGCAHWRAGRIEEALATVESAVGQEHPWYFDPQWTKAWMQIRLRRLDDAADTIKSISDTIDAAGTSVLASVPLALLSWAHLARGELALAEAIAASGVSAVAETGMPLFEPQLRAAQVLAALRRGDVVTAADRLKQLDHQHWSPMRGWITAQLVAARSGPAAAVDVLAEVREHDDRRRELLLEDPAAAAWCVRTALAANDFELARLFVTTAVEIGDCRGEHAKALLTGDVPVLVNVVEQYRDPWARASAIEDLGIAMHDEDRDNAVTELNRAMQSYDCLGAAWDAARVRRRLRRLGIRRRHWRHAVRPETGWGSLTATEEKVARLVARGLTNRQVGSELFISPHTVGFHLRQIYRKLAIQSRVDLARIAP